MNTWNECLVLYLGPRLHAAIVPPKEFSDLVLASIVFCDQRHGSFMGFHDWLRIPSLPKQIVGVRFWPHEASYLSSVLSRKADYLKPCGKGFEVFFDPSRDYEGAASGDQAFGFNKLMLSESGEIALVVDTGDLSPDEDEDIRNRLNLQHAFWEGSK
jgi:hypothetical protein